MSSFFSEEDRKAHEAAVYGAPDERMRHEKLARHIAQELVEDMQQEAREEFVRSGQVTDIRVNDRSPSNVHSPTIPEQILREALVPLVMEAFHIPETGFTIQLFANIGGDHIPGTYESHYRQIHLRIDFSPPLT